MTENVIADKCPACLAMDRADGAEDGWLARMSGRPGWSSPVAAR